jgi:hypothetical protein
MLPAMYPEHHLREASMLKIARWLPALIAVSVSSAAWAQADDSAYCGALIQRFERYVIKVGSQSPNTGSLDGNVAVAQCRAGNTAAGIPVLEKKLRDARVDLPARG